MTNEWNEAIEAAANHLNKEKKNFTCPEYSTSYADCLTARVHFEMAADAIRQLKRREG